MQRIPEAVLAQALQQAARAPSVHNTQPWSWRPTSDGVDLVAVEALRLTGTDPTGRDLVISCGAALECLRVTAAALGWRADVRRMPDLGSRHDTGHGARVLARVTFAEHDATASDRALAQAVRDRHTDRREPSSWPVPLQRVEQLSSIAREHGAFVTALSEAQADRLATLTAQAEKLQSEDPQAHDEITRWSTSDGSDRGVPAASRLSRATPVREETGPGPSPALRFPAGTLTDDAEDPSPPASVWLVLSTSSDDALSWLRAGEALAAIWLWTTCERLSLVPSSQPTEVEAVRRVLQDELLLDRSCPQLVLRVGWPQTSGSPVPRTGRRAQPGPASTTDASSSDA